ncbi:hypothetical protein GGR19_003118 [Croceicoccus naphthovorans]|nr:hypothetical protein [Croceicoccus naphthovorans]
MHCSNGLLCYANDMGPLAEFAIAVVFGTVGLYTTLLSISSYLKNRQRRELVLAACGLLLCILGIAVIIV